MVQGLSMSNAYQQTIRLESAAFNSRTLSQGQWVSLHGRKLQFVKRAFDGTLWLQDKGLPVNYVPGKALVLTVPLRSNVKRKPVSRFARNFQVALAGVALVALVNVIFFA